MIAGAELNALLNARNIEELWSLHTHQMAAYGFDRILYGYTRYRTENSLGDPEDFVVLSNHDEAYTESFIGRRLYLRAPMLRWALKNEGAGSWSLIRDMQARRELGPEEEKVLQFNHEHDVTAGYTISFKSLSARAKGAIALTARAGIPQDEVDALWQAHGEDILALNNAVHLKVITLPYSTPNRTLTERQREVLGWIGDGKTIQDTATIMGLTPATVEKHLRLARNALGVETTAQAVLKAAFQNQMFVLDR
jgi:LuxR family transcriptional regulator